MDKENPIDIIIDELAEYANEWVQANKGDDLKQQVFDTLNKNRTNVIYQLLGFDKSWGKWEIKNVNDKNRGFAHEALAKKIKDIELDWLDSEPIELKLNKQEIKQIEQSAKYEAKVKFKHLLEVKLESSIDSIYNEVIEEIAKSDKLIPMLKMQRLLKGNDE